MSALTAETSSLHNTWWLEAEKEFKKIREAEGRVKAVIFPVDQLTSHPARP